MSLLDKVNIYEGKLSAKGFKIGIVVSRFNEFITSKLLTGAIDTIIRLEGNPENVDVFWVPGAMEIAGVSQKLVDANKYNGLICLGAVIRGSTPHFEYVASEVSKSVAHLSRLGKIPVIYGVLTTDTIEQAIERAGTKSGNRGSDAAINLVEMMNLYNVIS